MHNKSSVEEIRRRFDADVERFSNLETGHTAAMDAALSMELVTQAAARCVPHARAVLDVGCGAGNYTLKLMQRIPELECTLVDLSQPMLDRAVQRIAAAGGRRVNAIQGDIREVSIGTESFDVILAAAVLHHLRSDDEWESVFSALFSALRPGGSLWIFDLVSSPTDAVTQLMTERYGEYLTQFRDEAYRDQVFQYIEDEDTPRSLYYQMRLMETCGFVDIDVLHKQCCFAAFGGMKPG